MKESQRDWRRQQNCTDCIHVTILPGAIWRRLGFGPSATLDLDSPLIYLISAPGWLTCTLALSYVSDLWTQLKCHFQIPLPVRMGYDPLRTWPVLFFGDADPLQCYFSYDFSVSVTVNSHNTAPIAVFFTTRILVGLFCLVSVWLVWFLSRRQSTVIHGPVIAVTSLIKLTTNRDRPSNHVWHDSRLDFQYRGLSFITPSQRRAEQ